MVANYLPLETETITAYYTPLTPRETQVLALIAEGLSNKLIGVHLNITDHTAKFHVQSVLLKLHAATRTHAAVLGLKLGLI